MGLGFSAVGIFGKLPFLCSSAVTFTFKVPLQRFLNTLVKES